ncbi:uncharacterized protein PAC_12211 [Phialocephala subalpina]|uniref:Uncharacterized protein n=1 Tax=Phialocephala subalpina TaxID=576137 RepID=A0A1L7XBA2_9HELO|nr:uncharacterized protein PAC_12211 [Phialocephala subalpina]
MPPRYQYLEDKGPAASAIVPLFNNDYIEFFRLINVIQEAHPEGKSNNERAFENQNSCPIKPVFSTALRLKSGPRHVQSHSVRASQKNPKAIEQRQQSVRSALPAKQKTAVTQIKNIKEFVPGKPWQPVILFTQRVASLPNMTSSHSEWHSPEVQLRMAFQRSDKVRDYKRAIISYAQLNRDQSPQLWNTTPRFDEKNADTPENENCAIKYENLAASASLRDMFSRIRERKVVLLSRQEPCPPLYPNCAGRLVFQTRAAAEAFINRANTEEGIIIPGQRLRVKWNRLRVKPSEMAKVHQTRVLRVSGPVEEVFAKQLELDFLEEQEFELVEMRQWLTSE